MKIRRQSSYLIKCQLYPFPAEFHRRNHPVCKNLGGYGKFSKERDFEQAKISSAKFKTKNTVSIGFFQVYMLVVGNDCHGY